MRGATLTTSAFVAALLITAAHAEGDAPRGEAHFKDCAACHKLDADANEVGPSLHGIFPRKAGELTYFRYSPAMRLSGVTWTAETLDKYIATRKPSSPPTACPMPACRTRATAPTSSPTCRRRRIRLAFPCSEDASLDSNENA
jgi:cytochrome c